MLAKTIIKETKNLTSKITTSSKTCVELGKELTYWLNNTFSGNPGTIDSFPIIEANDSMRSGDTEGLIEHIDTITEQITAHETELTTQGYPLSNKNDYQTLHDLLEGLNTEQEQQKNSSFLIVQTRLRSFVTPVTNTSGPYSVSTSFYIKTQTPKNTVPYYAQPSSTV